jgi:hypothetical protein
VPAGAAPPARLPVAWTSVTRVAGSVPAMSDTTPTGSSEPTDAERQYTEDLPDGSPSGDATKDPGKDSDHDSGGEPADPQ